MKKYIFLLLFFSIVFFILPLKGYAVQWTKKNTSSHLLDIEGSCAGEKITVYLYPANEHNSSPSYSAGVSCIEGRFIHKDNLREWNLPEGDYTLLVGEEQGKADSTYSDTIRIINESSQISSVSTPIPEFSESPDSFFLALVQNFSSQVESLSNVLREMKASLEDTTFSLAVKTAFSAIISALENSIFIFQRLLLELQTPPSSQIIAPTTPEYLPLASPVPSPEEGEKEKDEEELNQEFQEDIPEIPEIILPIVPDTDAAVFPESEFMSAPDADTFFNEALLDEEHATSTEIQN